jgi:hypothetical protein
MSNFNRSNIYTRTFQNDEEPIIMPAWFVVLAIGLVAVVALM